MFASWFNAGVRAIDICQPFSPREVGYFIPATTDKTAIRPEGCTLGVDTPRDVVIQANNVEVDDRGLVYIVDRASTGMHILRRTGEPARILIRSSARGSRVAGSLRLATNAFPTARFL